MSAFLYGISLQLKLDIRNQSLFITCYVVPLLFFLVMGTIFTSLMPEAKLTLISSMIVMGVSMGALIGVPPSLVEIYGSEIYKMYKANGIPLYFGLCTLLISAFVHLLIMSTIICILAPILFDAILPTNFFAFYGGLAVFILTSLSVASVLGLFIKSQSKLTMFSQFAFLPSIMLSGIMFEAKLLPDALQTLGNIFPATWGFQFLVNNHFSTILPLAIILLIATVLCALKMKRSHFE